MDANLARTRAAWAHPLAVVTAVVAAMVLTLGSSATAMASTAQPSGDQQAAGVYCTTFPGGSNHATVTAGLESPYGNDRGFAIWHAYGDWLEVNDVASNGHRIVALFSYCVDGHWHANLQRDSGPNEGRWDRETYKFNFAEGRGVRVQVCERDGDYLFRCGPAQYSHA